MKPAFRTSARPVCTALARRPRRALATIAAAAAVLLSPYHANALVLMDTPTTSATVTYYTGASPANMLPPRTSSQTGGTTADATLTARSFTPPTGAPDDTGFRDAHADAFQTASGFNTTRVSGAFANGRAYNRLFARTVWEAGFTVFTGFLPTTDVSLDYVLFPGAVALSTGSSSAAEAGVRYTIGGRTVGEIVLSRAAGQTQTTLTTTGMFVADALQRGIEVVEGITYEVVRSDAYAATMRIGTYSNLERDSVDYVMEAWLQMPGYELGGFAGLGDPFALRSDPQAAAALAFPGTDPVGLRLTEASPAPEPATWAMFAAGALCLALSRYRKGHRRSAGRLRRSA